MAGSQSDRRSSDKGSRRERNSSPRGSRDQRGSVASGSGKGRDRQLETVKAESGVGLEIVHAEPTEKIRKSNCHRACVTKSLWVVLTTI